MPFLFTMRTMLRRLALLALPVVLGLISAVSSAQSLSVEAAAAPQIRIVQSLPYALPDGEILVADMYLPAGKGPFPGIVFIHGGGWRSGDRTQLRRQATLMAENGFVGMAIEYRLTPAHPFPADFDDAKTAVRWLRLHADQFQVDGDRIAAVGSSAGAHLAAMLGVTSTSLPPGLLHRGPDDASVQAVVDFNGIYDLATMPPTTMESDLVGAPCAVEMKRCEQASPLTFVHAGLPPFLVMHGTADQTAPYSQAVTFIAALRRDGDPVEAYVADGGPHTFWSKPAFQATSFEAMRLFLQRTLRGGEAVR